MVTLAFAQMVYYIANEWRSVTRGENGLQSVPRELFGLDLSDPYYFYYAALPLVLLGVLDLFLAIILSLGAVTAYPFVRFRAALGLGFTGFILLTSGSAPETLGALAAGSIGLYCTTVFVRWLPVIVAAVLGLGGFGFVAWTLLS